MKLLTWTAAGLVLAATLAAGASLARRSSAAEGAGGGPLLRVGGTTIPRAAHQATLLPGGRVLVTGGCAEAGCRGVAAGTEVYDPVERAFLPGARMSEPRVSHAAAALDDGRVLVAGGWTGAAATASAELFDPASGRFTPAGRMGEPRMGAAAVRLADGRVLVVGGETRTGSALASAEVFDPDSGRWSAVGPMAEPRAGHVAVRLGDGRVLVTGGRRGRGEVLRSAELFDPATGAFRPAGEMVSVRHKHAAALLPDGRVLVLGGADERDDRGAYATTELYDPEAGTFSPGPGMAAPRYKLDGAVAALPSGELLVAGGAPVPELWSAERGGFEAVAGELDGALRFATATLLPGGEVLIVGGYDARIRPSASAWLFRG